MPIPDFVTLDADLAAFLGGFAGIFEAFFNVIAMVTVLWFIVLVGIQTFQAFKSLNDVKVGETGERSTAAVIRDTALNMAEVIVLALIVFLIVTNGPNVVFAIANGSLDLINPNTSSVAEYAGPFAGLFTWLQTNLALGIILFGTAYMLWRSFNVYRTSGAKREGYASGSDSNFSRLKNVITDVWQTGVLIVLLFLAVRFGPQLLFDLLGNSQSVIG